MLARAPIEGLDDRELQGWELLHAHERSWAAAQGPRRRREIVAGRLALRAALRAAGWDGDEPLAALAGGGPCIPEAFTGSISHKDGLAVAIAGRGLGRTLGIDVETLAGRERLGIAERVLRPEELDRWRAGGGRWAELLWAFALKEAVYKALYPRVRRYVGFAEAEILGDGQVLLHLAGGEGPFHVRSASFAEGDRLLAVVEISPEGGATTSP